MKRRLMVVLNRVVNSVVLGLRLRRFRGADLLYLTTTGRKSGTTRVTPLLYLPEDDSWVVVASNGGSDWEPGWWLNLRAGSPATVEVHGARTAVTGEEIDGDERDAIWRALNDQVFDYDTYQRKVSRRIAVVRLRPAPA